MITEDYVSFETAKLLKEKGFDWDCKQVYDLVRPQSCADGKMYDNFPDENPNAYDELVSAPTLQMAMKWLRKKHNQNITVEAYNNVARLKTIYYAEAQNLSEPAEKGFCVNACIFKDTYEEACEAAIKYCLENLI